MIIRIPSGHDLLRTSSTSESPMIGRTGTPTSFIDSGIPNVNPFFSGRDIHPRFRRYSRTYEVSEFLDAWSPSFASAGDSPSRTAMMDEEDINPQGASTKGTTGNKDLDLDIISATLNSIRQPSNASEKLATKNANVKMEEKNLNNKRGCKQGKHRYEQDIGEMVQTPKGEQKRRTYRMAACGHENNIGRKTCWHPGCGAKIKPSMTAAAMAKREW
eukprot:CAMPEP_0185255654 /NCGR_PEP_ID=MMETSP1359-20130426/4733_1 /TAXON_ID=552665 /ORGANISM="Bigelowiella longifila, Strain CCMP242" /LENGTH=215 /DNA_ID=CAMNT_0027839753 /DNA_START=139 /DNA_END=783 /DNA_ORIENTATION=+